MKTKIRVLSAIMTVVMILSSLVIVIPTSVSAAATTDADLWTKYAATAFAGGTGSATDPYQIKTPEQLALLAVKVNANEAAYKSAHYKVMNDIDASAHQWYPIGVGGPQSAQSFLGTFDGGNFKITTVVNNHTNFTFPERGPDSKGNKTVPSYHGGGLFGRFGGGTIKNVKLDFTFAWDHLPRTEAYNGFFGALTGTMYGSASVDNCHVTVHGTGRTAYNNGTKYVGVSANRFGGITGYFTSSGSIKNSSVAGTVDVIAYDKAHADAGGSYGQSGIGGFIGRLNPPTAGATFENLVNTLTIKQTTGNHNDYASGFAAVTSTANGSKLTLKNFVDAGTVIIPQDGLIKYGSLTSTIEVDNQTWNVENVLSIPTIRYAETSGWDQHRSTATLFADVDADGKTVNANFKNVFTGNAALPDFYVSPGSTNLVVTSDTFEGSKKITTNAQHDLGVAQKIDIATAVDAKAGTSTVTIPAGVITILKAIGATYTVTKGGVAAATTAEKDGAFVSNFNTTEGTAALNVTLSNGAKLVYHDMWIHLAERLVKTSTEDGSASKPYLIDSAEELAYLAWICSMQFYGNPPAMTVKLTKDIDLANREWTAIGSYTGTGGNEFKKDLRPDIDLYGDGFTIKNLTHTNVTPADRPAGLFGAVKNGMLIQNLNLTGSIKKDLSTNSSSVGVAMVVGGFASGSAKLENVHVDATVEAVVTGKISHPLVAGLVAYGNNVIIKNSTMSGSVKVSVSAAVGNYQPMAGGILARSAGVDILEGCVNYADVYVKANTSNSFAGGLVAITANVPNATYKNHLEILNCVNYGNVTIDGTPNNQRAGGAIGQVNRDTGETGAPIGGSTLINGFTNFGTIALGPNVKLGTSSGVHEVIGTSEAGTQTFHKDIPTGLTLGNILGMKGKITDDRYLIKNLGYTPRTFDAAAPGDRSQDKELVMAANGAQTFTGEEYGLEIGTVDKDGKAIISASKIALDIFVGAQYKMAITYNGKTIATNLSAATVSANGRAYEWTVEGESYKAGQKATISVTDPLGKNAPITSNFATWEGVYASTGVVDADGDGYYDIKTAGDLGYVARMANKASTNGVWKSVKMEMLNDIDFAGAYFGAITRSHNDKIGFNGEFIGTKSETENYKILNISVGYERYVYNRSMFGKTQAGFVFKDVDFVNPRVIGVSPSTTAGEGATSMTGGGLIAGSMYGDSLIENVNITGLDYNVCGANSYYGGVVGYMAHKDAIVRDVTVQGKVTGERGSNTAVNFGGITHRLRMGTIENCVVDLDIDVKFSNVTGNNYISMIASHAYSNGNTESSTIKNNTALGTIKVTVTDGTTNVKDKWVAYAGIVGFVHKWGAHTISGNVSDVDIVFNNKGANINCVKAATVAVVNPRLEDENKVAGVKPTIENNYSLNGLPIVHSHNDAATIGTNSQWDVAVETEGKASVRIDKTSEANSGIRFDSYINSVLYNAMKADSNVQVEIGTLIAPTVLMKAYNGKFDQLPAVVKVAYDVDAYAADGKGVNGFASIADGKSYFTGALVNVLPNNYKLEFTAVAYVTVTIHGVSHTYYAAYDANDEERARSIYDVAFEAYNDREATYSAEYGTFVGDNAENGNYSCYSTAQLNVLREYLGI